MSLVKDIVDSALYYYQRILFTIAFIGRIE